MFYSQVILAKKGPLAKVWLAAHWGDKKLARPQIFATDIARSVDTIVNPAVPLALRMSGHLLLGVVRIYSRKVRYVLNDCTEAMLKLQMAFHPTQGGDQNKELLEKGQAPAALAVVANFGEHDQVHAVEGFCLPLPDQNEWILADDDDEEEDDESMGMEEAVGMGGLPSPADASPGTPGYAAPREEAWVPFDPDNEDEDDEDMEVEGARASGRVSDVELARAAGDSFLSGDETRRASSILDKSMEALSATNTKEAPQPAEEEEDDGFARIPFDDDEEEDRLPGAAAADVVRLSHGGAAEISALDTTGLSGLDEEPTDKPRLLVEEAIPSRRKRKRRKVVIDNDATELSNEHIKAMLADPSDLVRRRGHPAEDREEEDERRKRPKTATESLSLTQPFLGDDGALHARLAGLWEDALWRALDKPCPYPRRQQGEGGVERARGADDDEQEEEVAPGTPAAGQARREEEEDEVPPPQLEDEEDFPAMALDDEEEEEEDAPPGLPDDEEEEEALLAHRSGGGLDLGMANELAIDSDAEETEENREALGEHGATSTTKWHKHTVKVLSLLQSRIRATDAAKGEDDTKPTAVEFADLARSVNRRTAASCFIECLQLKTWDFLELSQDEEYGTITISAGPRFSEAPPHKA